MCKKQEALKMALEALSDFDYEKRMTAITAIKEALAEQPAQQQEEQAPVTDEENEKFSRDVSNFNGADPEATKYALEEFLKSRAAHSINKEY